MVDLPSVRDEVRRAWGIFAFVVVVAVVAVVPIGVAVMHASALAHGGTHGGAGSTALWLGGWLLAFVVPFAGFGLVREVLRYRRARQTLGDRALLDATGVLRSEDGRRRFALSE